MSKSILNIYYLETLDKVDSYEEYLSSMNITLDTQLWKKSLLSNNKRAYQEYLNKYPKGNYSDEAQLKINEFNAINKREEEIKAWNKALNKNTKSSYEKYLMSYYNVLHSNEAKIKVDEFIRLEKEKELEKERLERTRLEENDRRMLQSLILTLLGVGIYIFALFYEYGLKGIGFMLGHVLMLYYLLFLARHANGDSEKRNIIVALWVIILLLNILIIDNFISIISIIIFGILISFSIIML